MKRMEDMAQNHRAKIQSAEQSTPQFNELRQKLQARRKSRKQKSASNQRIKTLELELEKAKKVAEKFKKRYQRCLNKTTVKVLTETPRSKTKRLGVEK